jgi:hypothetical protein
MRPVRQQAEHLRKIVAGAEAGVGDAQDAAALAVPGPPLS